MAKWLYKSLLLITGIFFALSILEIHGENSHNTFFDEDDTYVQSNNQNVELSIHFEKQADFSKEFIEFEFALNNKFFGETHVNCSLLPPNCVIFFPQKLFLRNSVFRI